jgi:hypothetical protein
MAEFLIQTNNETAPLRYWRGDVIQDYDDGTFPDGTTFAPGRAAVRVPGLARDQFRTQMAEWWRRLSYAVVSSNLAADSFRLTVSATDFNPTSGIGKLGAGMVETYLGNWGATNIIVADNAVTFDITILAAIKAKDFWRGLDITGMTLAELAYTQATGVHRCRVNYSASSRTPEELTAAIVERGGTVTGANVGNHTITFEMDRQDVRDAFQNDVKQRVEAMVVRRKFHIGEAAVQAIEAAGGMLTISIAQYNTYWKNKLTE